MLRNYCYQEGIYSGGKEILSAAGKKTLMDSYKNTFTAGGKNILRY